MVTLPDGFVATRFPGYFWNLKEKHLYSMKVDGILKPLKRQKPSRFNFFFDGWKISVEGQRRGMSFQYLSKLQPEDSVIPMRNYP